MGVSISFTVLFEETEVGLVRAQAHPPTTLRLWQWWAGLIRRGTDPGLGDQLAEVYTTWAGMAVCVCPVAPSTSISSLMRGMGGGAQGPEGRQVWGHEFEYGLHWSLG